MNEKGLKINGVYNVDTDLYSKIEMKATSLSSCDRNTVNSYCFVVLYRISISKCELYFLILNAYGIVMGSRIKVKEESIH